MTRAGRYALAAALAVGAALRLLGVFHDLPFSYFGDELHLTKRAMAMGTGDLNPHWFHKPALVMYLLLGLYALFYGAGRLAGAFGSPEEFGAFYLADPGPFLLLGRLMVAACGVATVYVVWRIGRQVFRGDAAAGWGAAAAAVLPAMVASSQHIKEDVPTGFLIALAVSLYLAAAARGGDWRFLAGAALAGGAAVGAKYYGIVLVPAFVAAELWRRDAGPPRRRLARALVVVVLFAVAFFAVSPYNFLDPTFGRAVRDRVEEIFGPDRPAVAYEPDRQLVYETGPRAWLGASGHLLAVFLDRRVLGWVLGPLALLGLAAALRRRETRLYGLLVLVAAGAFALLAAVSLPYHTAPRHLNAVLPLLCPLFWPGALVLARGVRLAERFRRPAAALLVALGVAGSLAVAVAHTRRITRLDSRRVARDWIVAHLPRDERLLLLDYGPALQPNRAAVRRQLRRLDEVTPGPFTIHQRRRLELLARHLPADGFDVEELGHQWWLPSEKSDAALRADPRDLDMGNPLVSRRPLPLAAYRAAGFRYVVANSQSRDYFLREPGMGAGFPSFVRFYRELDGLRPLRTFDPRRWGGKGPVIWIYDLAPARERR